MVLGVAWLLGLDRTLFEILGHGFSVKDLILVTGGLFLVYKAVTEIYKTTELTEEEKEEARNATAGMVGVVLQIAVIDMIFAIDSVLTAVGMTSQVALIIIAMTIAVLVMMFYSGPMARFIGGHPSVKMLALAFLVLVGVLMLADGFGAHVDRNYVYFAILFSLAVEALNFRRQANQRSRRGLEDEPTV
jgi:predicted tellurium resistance membrane protein TerC